MIFKLRHPIARHTYIALSILGFVMPLLLWHLISSSGAVSPLFLPSPTRVFRSFEAWEHTTLLRDIYVSVKQVVLGFSYAALLAVPVGLYIGTFKVVEAVFQPINDFFDICWHPRLFPWCFCGLELVTPPRCQ